ncbi:MAG: hypothetical protein O7D93_03850, partial [Acidobacteria bacterium]|nr:hypothetical protein [Acidobacteriota bacterium]
VQPAVNVDLGMIIYALAPGDQVSMPITLVTRNDPQVAKISLEIGYPSELISFVEVTLGGGAEAAGAQVKTELVETAESAGTGMEMGVDEPQDLEFKTVRLEITASRVIPEGVLVNLTFELSEKITLNHEIPLDNLGLTAQSLDGQEIRARGLGGSISPIEPIPACFFYMH